jgi:hypothetical protein
VPGRVLHSHKKWTAVAKLIMTAGKQSMKFIARLTDRLAQDCKELVHDMTIFVTDWRGQAPESRKIKAVILIVSYVAVAVMAFQSWAAMPPPRLPLAIVLVAVVALGGLCWWMIRRGHYPL